MKELGDFFNNDLGILCERESRIAFNYFSNDTKVFKKLYKSISLEDFKKVVNNIAWDCMAPRVMEYYIDGVSEDKKVFIPFFLTNDDSLFETLASYPIRAILFNESIKSLPRIIPIPIESSQSYFFEKNCDGFIKDVLKHSEQRRSTKGKNFNMVRSRLDKAYIETHKVLAKE